jgi:catechol 2,3-dioxygenase-like lactoylglutathione lyase family enzyme
LQDRTKEISMRRVCARELVSVDGDMESPEEWAFSCSNDEIEEANASGVSPIGSPSSRVGYAVEHGTCARTGASTEGETMTGEPMIDHVTLWVGDLPASRRFYEAALAPLSFGLEFEHDGLLAFGSGESGRLILYAGDRPDVGVHVAFSAPSPEAVDAFHAAALEAGGRDNGAPGPRPEYHGGYYGAYVFDPDGNNAEAVHHAVSSG